MSVACFGSTAENKNRMFPYSAYSGSLIPAALYETVHEPTLGDINARGILQ